MNRYSYYLKNDDGVTYAAMPPGDKFMSPAYITTDVAVAVRFDSFGEASIASQNFGPEWNIEEI